MRPSEIAELAASLAAGGITADAISDEYGSDVLPAVLSGAAGLGAAAFATSVMRASGVSDLIDDIFDW